MTPATARPTPRFGMVFSGDRHDRWLAALRVADRSGLSALGIGDSQSIYPDVYARCAIAATETSTLTIGPCVSNPITRHPAVTAGAIASIDEMSDGRAYLGIGTGDSAARNIGRPAASLAETEHYIGAVHDLLSTGSTVWNDAHVHLDAPTRAIPILLAASGPATLELAGRIADGVIVGVGLETNAIASAKTAIERGLRTAGRSTDDIVVWWMVLANVAERGETALSEIKNSLASYAHMALRSQAALDSVPAHLQVAIREIQRRYQPKDHATFGTTTNSTLTDEVGATEFLAERFAVTGTPSAVAARLRHAFDDGAHNVMMVVRVPDKLRVLRLWKEDVLPLVGPSQA